MRAASSIESFMRSDFLKSFARPTKKGTLNWNVTKVFSTALTQKYALRNENNLRYIKFPNYFKEKTVWNGNIFNDTVKIVANDDILELFSKQWTFTVLSFGKSEKIGKFDVAQIIFVA